MAPAAPGALAETLPGLAKGSAETAAGGGGGLTIGPGMIAGATPPGGRNCATVSMPVVVYVTGDPLWRIVRLPDVETISLVALNVVPELM